MSTSLTAQQLTLYALDLLDPPDQLAVGARVALDPRLAQRVVQLRAEEAGADPRTPWRIPPPGLGPMVELGRLRVAGTDMQIGNTLRLRLADVEGPEDWEVVVLRRLDSTWQVWLPWDEESRVRMSQLEVVEGQRVVDLALPGPPGPQRWAVIRVRRGYMVDWSAAPDERWRQLREDLAAGRAEAGQVELVARP